MNISLFCSNCGKVKTTLSIFEGFLICWDCYKKTPIYKRLSKEGDFVKE